MADDPSMPMVISTFCASFFLTFVLGDLPAHPGRSVLVDVARVEADTLRVLNRESEREGKERGESREKAQAFESE